jgi:hypothetical protein
MKSGPHLAHHEKQDYKTMKKHHLLNHYVLQNGVPEEQQLGSRIMNILRASSKLESSFMVLQGSSKLKFFAPMSALAKSQNIILAL